MARAARSPSPISLLVGLVAVVVLAACARRAPDLPPDYGSVTADQALTAEAFSSADRARTCGDIDTELAVIADKARALDDGIRAKSQTNQAVVYIAGVIAAPLVDYSIEAKESLDTLQARHDDLISLKRYKACL